METCLSCLGGQYNVHYLCRCCYSFVKYWFQIVFSSQHAKLHSNIAWWHIRDIVSFLDCWSLNDYVYYKLVLRPSAICAVTYLTNQISSNLILAHPIIINVSWLLQFDFFSLQRFNVITQYSFPAVYLINST